MNKLIISTFLVLCASNGWAQSTPALQEGLGFYQIEAAGVPPAVKAAADSVFEIRTLALDDEKSFDVVDVRAGRGAVIREKLRTLVSNQIDEMDRTVLIEQIRRCEASADPEVQEHCVFTQDISRASGFLATDGQTLWTNAHVIQGYVETIQKYEKVSIRDQFMGKHEIRAFVFNRAGELVLNPFTDKVTAKIWPELTPMAKLEKSFFAEDSDFVILSLSKSLGRPLPLAAQPAALHDLVYVLGYAGCTACDTKNFQVEEPADFADRSPRPNSDGKGLKVTAGRITSANGLAEFFGLSEAFMNLWQLDQMVFNTADSQHGNSGGPTLNENGEVIAIHTGGKSRFIDGKLQRISRGILVPAAAR